MTTMSASTGTARAAIEVLHLRNIGLRSPDSGLGPMRDGLLTVTEAANRPSPGTPAWPG
jgi:hypothetical protein